ncbi:MAG: DUF2905 domain-containing protein [Hyphomicrobium sp.]
MLLLLSTALIILLTLSGIAYVAGRGRGDDEARPASLTLLPGDISYENKSGNVKVYFPITTSIVLSIVLTILMRFFS